MQRCRLCWRRAPLLQAHSGPVPVWHHLCSCPPAPTCLTSPARSGIFVLSEPFPGSVPFFRSLFGVIPAMSHGVLQEQPLMGRTGRCAAPSPSADLPAESAPPPSRQSFTLPSPRLLPEALAAGKVREHREHCVSREPAALRVSLPVCEGALQDTSRGARPQGRNPLALTQTCRRGAQSGPFPRAQGRWFSVRV